MGIAILGVVLGHNSLWWGMSPLASIPFRVIENLVWADGFLFLSGLGLYYSFSNHPNIRHFGIRRIQRVYLPFIIIAFPYFLLELLCGYDAFGDFLLKISGLWFFVYGNYAGNWYISMSLVLYILFPLLYKFIVSFNRHNISLQLRFVVVASIAIVELFRIFFPAYFGIVKIGILKFPMFALGIMFGYLSYNKVLMTSKNLLCLLCLCIALLLWRLSGSEIAIAYYCMALRLFCMILITYMFESLNSSITSSVRNGLEWLGKYSLEIYLLHVLTYTVLLEVLDVPYWALLLNFIIPVLLCYPTKLLVDKFIHVFM